MTDPSPPKLPPISKQKYVPHNALDSLVERDNAAELQRQRDKLDAMPASKKKEKCPHLQYWEQKLAIGVTLRKCYMCPHTEMLHEGKWIQPDLRLFPKPPYEATIQK